MRLISVCCVLLALVVSCTAQSGHPVAPRYAVDLDAPAKERWVDVIANFKDQYGPIQAWINTLISPALQSFLEPYLEDIDTLLPGEFGAELIGVAQGSGMHLGEIVVLNLIYDLTAFCTSIVAQSNNGSIYHARNLDYDIPGLRNITVQIDFQKGGVTQYSCTTFAGYVGCLTGVRPGGFSITIDERDVPGESILDNFLAIFHGGQSIGFFVRDTLANQTDFSSAITVLADDYLIAPCYIIVGGVNPGEGAVITRNRSHAIDVWRIDFPQRWWLVETNYDHWLAPPPNDDRRDPANKAMAAIGSAAITPEGMFNVLSIPPVLNDGTQYTTMMMAATGFMESHIRLDTPPMSTADLMARRLQRKYQQVV